MKNTISKLYNAVSAPVTATRDAVAENLQNVRDTASLLYNLNNSNTKMIMTNITPRNEMIVKVIFSFKSVIYRGAGEIKPYSKTLDSSPGMFTSLNEIQAFIEKCK